MHRLSFEDTFSIRPQDLRRFHQYEVAPPRVPLDKQNDIPIHIFTGELNRLAFPILDVGRTAVLFSINGAQEPGESKEMFGFTSIVENEQQRSQKMSTIEFTSSRKNRFRWLVTAEVDQSPNEVDSMLFRQGVSLFVTKATVKLRRETPYKTRRFWLGS